MKKIINVLFYVFCLFLIVNPIWSNFDKLNYIFSTIFLILALLIFFLSDKKSIKLDKFDFLLGLLPFFYVLPFFFQNNHFSFLYSFSFILLEFSLTTTILILRRFINRERINDIFVTICLSSTIYFFISFLYPVIPKSMYLFNIYSYFGDTYINSIDRLYGPLGYCNTSALFFLVSVFISLFKMNEDSSKKIFLELFYLSIFVVF